VVNDFDLVSGFLEGESVKQPLITKTRKGENTKEEGGYSKPIAFFRAFQISCFRGEAVSCEERLFPELHAV
jgi:hypothetical protein